MQDFPHHYSIAASASIGGDVTLEGANLPPLTSAPPAEFGGPANVRRGWHGGPPGTHDAVHRVSDSRATSDASWNDPGARAAEQRVGSDRGAIELGR